MILGNHRRDSVLKNASNPGLKVNIGLDLELQTKINNRNAILIIIPVNEFYPIYVERIVPNFKRITP